MALVSSVRKFTTNFLIKTNQNKNLILYHRPNKLRQLTTSTKSDISPGILLSPACIRRLSEICDDGSFLRITVEGGGCSGFQYKYELDKKIAEEDKVFGPENARVVVDQESLEFINGATLDYHTELIRAGFKIVSNPKAEAGCSCGASFALRMD